MEDIPTKKSKKEKKHKRHREVESKADDQPIDLDTFPASKKEKKQKRKAMIEESFLGSDQVSKHQERMAAETQNYVDLDKPTKEKKMKKQKREVIDLDAVEPLDYEAAPASSTSDAIPIKEKKKKKRKETQDGSSATPEKQEPAEISIQTPIKREKATPAESQSFDNWGTNSGPHDELSGGARYWKRIDEGLWKNKVTGTKYEKVSHYDKGGDAWGNEAADILGKVKGKGFVKAMQKLKRASWKGQGSLDTGVNSVQFSDWDD
jgi:hypothetical protein